MSKFFGAVLGLLYNLALIFLIPILTVLVGAMTGYVTHWAMPDTFTLWQTWTNMQGFEPWQIGAGLGFVGSFFRSVR